MASSNVNPVVRQLIQDLALFLGRTAYLFIELPKISMAPEAVLIQYQKWEEKPNLILDMESLAQLVLRGNVQLDDAYVIAKKHGVSEGIFRSYVSARQTLPNLEILLELKRRGYYDEEETAKAISRLGYSDNDTTSLSYLSERLPSVQDTITFLVREVYNPTIRDNLQLDAEYPREADRQFERLGLSLDNARNYWAAHWRLPSVQLSFEMYHRNLITEEDLRFILRASDILPRFRDAIIQAAYRPITRVDVRRMHDMGVLDDDGVERAYLDIGYSPDNARLMLEWTKLYNQDLEQSEHAEEARQITRSQIVKLFVRGVWTAETAIAQLVELGYTEQLAQLLILSEQIDLEQEQRDNFVQAVSYQYRNGVLGYAQATGLIAGAGLEGTELDLAISKLGVPETDQTPVPTMGQLNRTLKQGLLEPEEYLQTLVRRGYSFEWAGRFLESYGPGSTGSKPRPNGKPELDRQLQERQITFDQWESALADIGYPEEMIGYHIQNLPLATDQDIQAEEDEDEG